MRRTINLFIYLLLCALYSTTASIYAEERARVEMPSKGMAGEKIVLKIQTTERLPASSFYRVDFDCPIKPEGSRVSSETGYPLSDIIFDKPGKYGCVVEFGIVSKGSCAGARYKSLGSFKINVDIE